MEPKGYTDVEAVENYMLQTIEEEYQTQVDSWIAGVEKIIEEMTGRIFIADDTASARLFDGDDTPDLLIDECVDVTKVEVGLDSYGGSFLEIGTTGSDKYFEYPENAVVKGQSIKKITLNARCFPAGRQNNRITAKWGYSVACPADIQFAATVFVAGILNQQRGGGDKVASERIGNYAVTYSNDGRDSYADFERAKEIVESYKRIRI